MNFKYLIEYSNSNEGEKNTLSLSTENWRLVRVGDEEVYNNHS